MWDLLENEILEFLDEEGNTKEENDGTRLELKGQLLKLQGEFNQSDRKETQLDVLKFWKNNHQKCSTMTAFVKMMLCNMPSSASSERTFKSISMLYGEDQDAFDGATFEKMVFIRGNMHFLPQGKKEREDWLTNVAEELSATVLDDDNDNEEFEII